MAQPIYCDLEGCGDRADLIVSTLDPTNAVTSAWCTEHWVEFAGMVYRTALAEREAASQAAGEPDPEPDVDAADQAAIDSATERLEAFGLEPAEARAVLAAEAEMEQGAAGAPQPPAEAAGMESSSEQGTASQPAAGDSTEPIEQPGPEAGVDTGAPGSADTGSDGPPDVPATHAATAAQGAPTDPAKVVKRGTSPSRRRHEARKREREQPQEGVQP